MNAQQIFDTVARHLLTQRQKSVADDRCLYRGPNGLRCAAGILIPDDKYSSAFENNNVTTIPVWESLGLPNKYRHLVSALQSIHDDASVEVWPRWLIDIAIDHHLCPDIVAEMAPEGQWQPL